MSFQELKERKIYFSDHLKTASVVTDSAGNIKAESDYYPWGGELQFVAGDSNHYKFTGKERDSETGLDYFGARYYSNGLGRFITPDWAAKPAAVPYAVLGDPQSLNLYSYVRNIPTTAVDADGHAISYEFNWSPLDASPAVDEGGPSTTQVAMQLARMSSSAFGWELEAQQAQQAQAQNQNSAAAPALNGPFVADLKSPQIAPLLDRNHNPSNSDVVGPNGECVDLTKKFSGHGRREHLSMEARS